MDHVQETFYAGLNKISAMIDSFDTAAVLGAIGTVVVAMALLFAFLSD